MGADDARPRDFWMCGHPGGCDAEPLWVPLTGPAPYCRTHDRRYERQSEIAARAGARATSIGRRGAGAPAIPRRR